MKFSCIIIVLTLIAAPVQAGSLTCAEAINLFKQSAPSHITQSPLQDFEWDADRLKTTMRWFIESIDPENLIFSKQELNSILQDGLIDFKEEAAKLVEEKDCSLFKTIHALKPKLLSEIINELGWYDLQLETVKSWDIDRNSADQPIDLESDRPGILRRWRGKLSDDIRFQMASMKISEADAYKLALRKFQRKLIDLAEIDPDSTHDHLLNALFKTLDVHSRYISQEEIEKRKKLNATDFEGVGILFQETLEGVSVSRIFEHGPAYKEGLLKEGDIITEVGGVSLAGLTMTDVMKLMRGPDGTRISLHVKRNDDEMDFLATRGKVEQKVNVLDERLHNLDGVPVGYIKVATFAVEGVGRMFQAAVDRLEEKKMQALVVDLRDNMGGNPDEMRDMVDYLIEGDVMFMQKYNLGDPEIGFDSIPGPPATDVPLVVLVNARTASASEAFAGIIKAYKRGVVVGGLQTFGKGTSQSSKKFTVLKTVDGVQRLQARGLAWITQGYYYLPDGTSAQYDGIKADVVIEKLAVEKAVYEKEIPGSLKAPPKLASEMDSALFHFNDMDTVIERLKKTSTMRQNDSEQTVLKEALSIARDWVESERHLNAIIEARDRCYGLPEDGEVLYKDAWGDWDFKREEIDHLFDKVYHSSARLGSRVYFDPDMETFVLPVKNLQGEWTAIPVANDFIKALITHIEKAQAEGWADYVMLADMGHGHFMIPKNVADVPDKPRLEDVINHPQTKILYHTGEMLKFYSFTNRTVVDNAYVNFRREHRNLLGYLDGSGKVEILQEPEDRAFNLVRMAPGHRRFLDFEFSSNKNGCFPFRDNDGKITYFDINYFGTPKRPGDES